jgi:hypothetical protein
VGPGALRVLLGCWGPQVLAASQGKAESLVAGSAEPRHSARPSAPALQEIVGLGISNFAGAMTSCYSTTGSFSCSAVNNDSGG